MIAKPRWESGYLGSTYFSNLLINSSKLSSSNQNFLSVGCGEVLPFIIRNWEAKDTVLSCVDLSKNSIQRAKFRCAFLSGKTHFYNEDINHLNFDGKFFDQIEAYGVIHHIQNYRKTLSVLKDLLAPEGVMRIMVYNSHSRTWIWHINRAFRQLKLNFSSNRDVKIATNILLELSSRSSFLQQRLSQIGVSKLKNKSWFADTFMNPWEARTSVENWIDHFELAGLKPIALFDRYGELDDLDNPLWVFPTKQQLLERSLDLRFENNLEIWLTHNEVSPSSMCSPPKTNFHANWNKLSFPKIWGEYPETKNLSSKDLQTLWHGLLMEFCGGVSQSSSDLIQSLPLKTSQRLARIGAISKQQAQRLGMLDKLTAKLHNKMTPPDYRRSNCSFEDIESVIEKFIHLSPKTQSCAVHRLQKIL